ncbi:autotransporter assembly complex family protein [Pasteurellaceae bacterium LIM206]|nr:autotransporter assembly complex family protein [Pasteurellaceae bacterium LIM206]
MNSLKYKFSRLNMLWFGAFLTAFCSLPALADENAAADNGFTVEDNATTDNGAKSDGSVNLKVEGIKNSTLSENVRLYLENITSDESDGSERYQSLVRENIDKALRVYGYYDSQVSFESRPARSGKPTLIAHVDIGEPTLIEGTDVVITGDAKEDEAFIRLNDEIPAKGTRLNHETYDDYKSSLQKLAASRGYFDADFPVHQLQVMPSAHQAWWNLEFNSGSRYRYGEISFENSQIREEYLRNMLNIHTGEAYLINDVSEMTNNYSSMGWFQTVMVRPELQEASKTVDLHVMVQPKKKNRMEVGLGYSSDVGMRGQLGWTRPWINGRGHSLSSNLYVSSPKQTLELTYKMPLLRNPYRYYDEFSGGIENEDDTSTDTKSLAATLAALRYWNHPTGWQYSGGLRLRYDRFTQADEPKQNAILVYPTVSASRTRVSGTNMHPTRMDKINATFDLGRKWWLSDVNFFSIRASAGWIKTFAENHRFVLRGEIGYLNTKELEKIPPALRFFAGGDKSVRGYGYKKISPKNSNGKLIGASRLATASVEYQYQVVRNWWVAAFFDTGLAANSFSSEELRYGTGMGVRWASPVGAIKFDIATPVRDKDNSKNVQFYIGLGAEL